MRHPLRWLAVLFFSVAPVHADEISPPIQSADYPSAAARVPFFEKRINATDSRIRQGALIDAEHLSAPVETDYVQFLRRMTRDRDPWIRGRAIKSLHDLWIPLKVNELPTTFAGYHPQLVLNLEDENLTPRLLTECRRGGAEGGWAAECLGLLRRQQAVPDLVKLGDDSNSYACYAAGRALLDCGAKKEATAVLHKLMSHPFKPKNQPFEGPGYRHDEPDPFYVASAARAFIEVGPAERKDGLRRLIALLGELEPSSDGNDQNRLHTARLLLAQVTGEFFVSHQEAEDWLSKQRGDK